MPTVWIVDEAQGNLGDLEGTLKELCARSPGIQLPLGKSAAFATLPVQAGDVVVIEQHLHSQLPNVAPNWLTVDVHLLPVIAQAADAARLKPYLKGKNALVRGVLAPNAFLEVLADEVITRAVLARQTRNVFISYQRSATLGVARDLASALQSEGFSTFLDEQSIRPGGDIDAEIAYRLNDVDLVVLLATETLQFSEWVHKEICFASNALIGVLAVDCDGSSRDPSSALAPLYTVLGQDRVRRLDPPIAASKDALSTANQDVVLEALRQQRVACIARRIAELVPAAVESLERHHPQGTIVSGPLLGDLRVQSDTERTRVLPFRPTADALWDARQAHPGHKLNIVHPENVPDDPRVRALRWLTLPVEIEVELQDVKRLWI